MAVTDLTNTKWIINTTVEVPTSFKLFDVVGTARSSGYTLDIARISFDVNSSGTSWFVSFREYAATSTTSVRSFYYYDSWELFNITSRITLNEPITLAITGGTDVTNPDLISWLEANAVEQSTTKSIIKAGTYRFKDKLTIPSWLTDIKYISIGFTTPALCNTDKGGTIIPWDDTDVYNRIILLYTDAGFTVIHNNSENLANIHCYTEEKAWNSYAYAYEQLGYTNYELANGYGQIITVTEDTEVDDDVFEWLTENLRDKIFTRLYLGDVAYSSGGKRFRKLQTEIPNVVGGWLFNEVISDDVPLPVSFRFTYDGLYNVLATAMEFRWFSDGKKLYYEIDYTGATPAYNFDSNEWSNDGKRYISIVDQPTNAEFIQWLIRNAKRR